MGLTRDDIIRTSGATFQPVPGIIVPEPQTSSASDVIYRKTTAKAVNTTITATDLLNGEITIEANVMGKTGTLRMLAFGTILNNSGAAVGGPRFVVKLGGTTMIDTATVTSNMNASTSRGAWHLQLVIQNVTSSSQIVHMAGLIMPIGGWTAATAIPFTTGTGMYEAVAVGRATATITGGNTGLAVNTAVPNVLALQVVNGSAAATVETALVGAFVEIV